MEFFFFGPFMSKYSLSQFINCVHLRSKHNGDLLDQVKKLYRAGKVMNMMNKKETRTERNSNKNASVAVDLTQIINNNPKKKRN